MASNNHVIFSKKNVLENGNTCLKSSPYSHEEITTANQMSDNSIDMVWSRKAGWESCSAKSLIAEKTGDNQIINSAQQSCNAQNDQRFGTENFWTSALTSVKTSVIKCYNICSLQEIINYIVKEIPFIHFTDITRLPIINVLVCMYSFKKWLLKNLVGSQITFSYSWPSKMWTRLHTPIRKKFS